MLPMPFGLDKGYGGGSGGYGSTSGIGAMLGGGLGSLFGLNEQQDPMQGTQQYYNQIPGIINRAYSPYIQAGHQALGQLNPLYSQMAGNYGGLSNQYQNLMQNPGQMINQWGQGFQQSPGYEWQRNQALDAANRSAAAGGSLGTPANQQFTSNLASQLANQEYQNYLNRAQGLYGQGLQGQQGLFNTGVSGLHGIFQGGQEASGNQANALANLLQQQAMMQYTGTQQQNQNKGQTIGNIGSLVGGGLGQLFGF